MPFSVPTSSSASPLTIVSSTGQAFVSDVSSCPVAAVPVIDLLSEDPSNSPTIEDGSNNQTIEYVESSAVRSRASSTTSGHSSEDLAILQARANAAAAAAKAAQALKEQADAEVRLAEARARSGKSSRATHRSRESQQDIDEVDQQLTGAQFANNDGGTGPGTSGPASSHAHGPHAHGADHQVQLPHRDPQNNSSDAWWKAWFPSTHRRDSEKDDAPRTDENIVPEVHGPDAHASLDPRAEYLAELKSKTSLLQT